MAKPCKNCGSEKHTSTFCYQALRKPILVKKRIARIGKVTKQWIETKHEWFKANPAETYNCYLRISPQCLRVLDKDQVTLDHVKSRTRHPELRFELSNLKPACRYCNELKASKDVEELRV